MLDGFFVATAMEIDIGRVDLAIKKIDVFFRDVDFGKEMFVEPRAVALGAIDREAEVFIETEDDAVGEIESLFAMESDQFEVGTDGGGTGREAHDRFLAQFGPFANQSGDHLSRMFGEIAASIEDEGGNVGSIDWASFGTGLGLRCSCFGNRHEKLPC